MKNALMVQHSLEWLWSQGVRDLCVCPGGRNSPFVVALENEKNFCVHTGFDERATGFFALGLAQKQQAPVAVIVTSGTAVAELLPALMEAYYTQTPLVVISADRPRRMRGTGAPQTVDQLHLFGNYVEKCVDMEDEFVATNWSRQISIHFNICFDEPLIDGAVNWQRAETVSEGPPPIRQWQDGKMMASDFSQLQKSWQKFCQQSSKTLLILSTLSGEEDRAAVKSWASGWQGWIYAEGPSGLREIKHPGLLLSGDRFLQQKIKNKEIDGVLRLGGVPTARVWRNLETSPIPVFSISHLPFPGLSRGEMFSGSLCEVLKKISPPTFSGSLSPLVESDRKQHSAILKLLEDHPQSEPALMAKLSELIPSAATLYIGNSLPIREWDAFAVRHTERAVKANRGANGIDGQLSTSLAYLDPHQPLWVILGDLTALYDSNALWFWKKNPHTLKLVVMNNQGGKIFERLFKKNIFYNEHEINFKSWAEQWGLSYQKVLKSEDLSVCSGSESMVIEIQPSHDQTQQFWNQFEKSGATS